MQEFGGVGRFALDAKQDVEGSGASRGDGHFCDCTRNELTSGACLYLRDFLDGAMALVDGDVGKCVPVCVGLGDDDSSERLASNHAWTIRGGAIEWFEEPVVFVGVSVRPAVHGDGLNVSRGIESARREHSSKLIVNVLFEGVEGGSE